MEKENFQAIVTKLKYPKNEWLFFHEIESIILNSGRGIYPNWKYQKFLIKENYDIIVRYGKVKPYGARLNGFLYMSGDHTTVNFAIGEKGIQIENSSFYGEFFRQPKAGDVLRISDGINKILGESIIKEIRYQINSVSLVLWNPIGLFKNGKYSFFDNSVLNSDSTNCIHGTISEGIYQHFIPNDSKSKDKRFGIFHEEIKFKSIKEINLIVGKEYFDKTFKLE